MNLCLILKIFLIVGMSQWGESYIFLEERLYLNHSNPYFLSTPRMANPMASKRTSSPAGFWKKATAFTNTVLLMRKCRFYFIYPLGTPMVFLDKEIKDQCRAGRLIWFLLMDGQNEC